MNRTSALIVVLMTLGLVAGCSADPDEGGAADPEPVGDPNTTVASAGDPVPVTTSIPTSAPETSPVTVAVAAGDEVYLDTSSGQLIHRDGNGAYICVLRRQDDLADLRAGFTSAADLPAEAS